MDLNHRREWVETRAPLLVRRSIRPDRADPDAALTATLRGGETEDVIHFPDNVKEGVLKPFGTDLAAKFAAESPNFIHLWLPDRGSLNTGSRSLLTSPWIGVTAAATLPQNFESGSTTSSELATIFSRSRARRRCPRLSRDGSASWLREAGAEQLSEQVLADLLELAIFAGCERDKESLRLGRDLRLPLVLYGPGFVRGEKDVRPTKPISPAAQELVREWGDNGLIVEGRIRLSALYRAWRKRGERLGLSYIELPTYWEPFTANDVNLKPDDAAAVARFGFGEMVSLQVHALVSEQRIAGSSP